MPEMAHTLPDSNISYIWESLFTVLRRQIGCCSLCRVQLFFSFSNVLMRNKRSQGGVRVSKDWPFSTPCTCHTVMWILAFNPPPQPPSFSYIMNDAGWVTGPQRKASLPLGLGLLPQASFLVLVTNRRLGAPLAPSSCTHKGSQTI